MMTRRRMAAVAAAERKAARMTWFFLWRFTLILGTMGLLFGWAIGADMMFTIKLWLAISVGTTMLALGLVYLVGGP